jgi:hypothetical protein
MMSAGVSAGAASPNHEEDTTAEAKLGEGRHLGEEGNASARPSPAPWVPERMLSTVVLASLMNTSTSPVTARARRGRRRDRDVHEVGLRLARNSSLARWMAPPGPTTHR